MRPPGYLLALLSPLALVATAALATAATEPVDLLVTGGTVITMDASFRVVEDGAVAVRGERIVAVGPAADLSRRYTAAKTIDATGRIVMPGLVNTHTHVPMTLLRGVADDVELMVWLTTVHLARGERPRHDREFVTLGHAARGLGDDPHRHHHLRRHVLLRGPGGGGREGSRAPRVLRGHGHGPSRCPG